MLLIHDSTARGRTQTGWLDARHSFAFGSFADPKRPGFARLRVLNEDHIAPGAGFPAHDHADMDILTIVLSGAIAHEDNLGNRGITRAGEAQLMQAGAGIVHSERNPSETEPTHLLQIWLIPDRRGGVPGYAQAALPKGEAVLAGPGGLLPLGSDTRVTVLRPGEGAVTRLQATAPRKTFLHLVEGLAWLGQERLRGGDGVQLADEPAHDLHWHSDGFALLFDMP
ncbi:pirin family protein [Gemmobacter denitrificans]|uniref:Pirin family protein n=1 Tax=Gemmobacter denitrificans TaxID=3123040 RepID=A0ABU8BX95_9RHOB